MKSVRIDFSKGMNLVGEKRLLPEGYCLLADNVDLRSGTMRPFHYPDFFRSVPEGTTRIWEYRGKWYASDHWRDYKGEVVGQKERVYFTETGPSATYASKFVDGTQAKLGTPPPKLKPVVTKGSNFEAISLSAVAQASANPAQTLGTSTANNGLIYRVASKNSNNVVQAASVPTRISLAGPSDVLDTWNAIPNSNGYVVYGRLDNGQSLGKIADISSNSTTFLDDGSNAPDLTSQPVLLGDKSFHYIYTYVRDVNGMQDESGPSPISDAISASSTRVITRNGRADGAFVVDAANIFVNPAPAIVSEISDASSALDTTAILPTQNYTVIVTDLNHTLKNGDEVGMVGLLPSSLPSVGATVTIPTAATIPQHVSAEVIGEPVGSTLADGYYVYTLTGVRGDLDGSGIKNNAHGAQTVASESFTVHVPVPNAYLVKVKCNFTDDVDSYYVYRDGVFRGLIIRGTGTPQDGPSYNDIGQAAVYPSGGSYTPPTIPTTDETVRKVFFLQGITASKTSEYPPSGFDFVLPQVVIRPTTLITITGASLTGIGTGAHSVRMSSWANGSMNGTFIATVTSANDPITFTVPTFEPSDETSGSTPYKVEFGVTNSAGVDEFSFYKFWRLYRTGDTAEFLMVAEIPITQLSYTDVLTVDQLGDTPTSYYWDNGLIVVFVDPPRDLHGIELHYGMLFGISSNTVRWTPIGMPDAWPDVFVHTFAYEPLALAAYASFLVVLCTDALYLISGFQPASLTLSKSQAEDGVIAPRSVQKSPEGLIYLARRGVMLFNALQATCISEMKIPGNFFLSPSTLSEAIPFWWYPSESTYNYAAATFNQHGGYGDAGVSQGNPSVLNAENAVIEGPVYNIRSFYYQNKYFLFWSDFV